MTSFVRIRKRSQSPEILLEQCEREVVAAKELVNRVRYQSRQAQAQASRLERQTADLYATIQVVQLAFLVVFVIACAAVAALSWWLL